MRGWAVAVIVESQQGDKSSILMTFAEGSFVTGVHVWGNDTHLDHPKLECWGHIQFPLCQTHSPCLVCMRLRLCNQKNQASLPSTEIVSQTIFVSALPLPVFLSQADIFFIVNASRLPKRRNGLHNTHRIC